MQACNALLDGLIKLRRFDSMWDLYKELLSRGHNLFYELLMKGIPHNVNVYTTVIKLLCNESKMLEAGCMFRLIKEGYSFQICTLIIRMSLGKNRMMISDRLGPNIVTFGILIDGLCKVGKLTVARRYFVCRVKYVEEGSFLLQKMNKDGVLANSVTYNSLIDRYCKVGNMEKAFEICFQMKENGVEPNVITFSTLINGYCKIGNMEATVGFYSEMVIKSLVLDVVAFTALINGYCKNGNIKEAFRLHKEMLESGLMPNVFTLSSLIDGLCKDGRV
ncbi:hypothetical protein CXB51_005869 [Gossypium anomalum]|uniref:Pentatricopeptide repeat-containing protein n=1 Tax=Gossypium anomalum TaxID=47600 RepID=A0A8J5ZG43_9ROSI|nr:hypothetical protein CXB51_005869 [Gossypium anomalum]